MSKEKKEKKERIAEFRSRSARAYVKFLRIAPRKLRGVVDTVRFKHPEQAFNILMTLKQKGAPMVEKLLKSAVANAKVLNMEHSRLVISDIRVDGGPAMKRFMARSMGRADKILKRTSHLSIVLTEGQKKWKTSSPAVADQEEKNELKSGKKNRESSRKKAAAGA